MAKDVVMNMAPTMESAKTFEAITKEYLDKRFKRNSKAKVLTYDEVMAVITEMKGKLFMYANNNEVADKYITISMGFDCGNTLVEAIEYLQAHDVVSLKANAVTSNKYKYHILVLFKLR